MSKGCKKFQEIMQLNKGDKIGWKIIWDSKNQSRSIEIIKVEENE